MTQTHFQLGIKAILFEVLKHLKPPPALPVTDTFHSLLRLMSHLVDVPSRVSSSTDRSFSVPGEAVPGVPGGAVPAVPAGGRHPAVPADTDGLSLRAVPGPGQRRVPGTPRQEGHGPSRAGERSTLCSRCSLFLGRDTTPGKSGFMAPQPPEVCVGLSAPCHCH